MSIKQKAITGIAWSGIERFSVQGIQFIIQVIMARLLLPSDYGVIAMLAIFLAISQTIIDSGFSLALIQKKDRTELDYTTVFYFNIGVSFVFFILLFLSSPYISAFYKTPILIPVIKVVSFNLIIAAFSVVPRAKLNVLVDFKTQAKASLTAVIISGVAGIWLAFKGFGVWSLVIQSLLNNGLNTLFLFILTRWMPMLKFSFSSFKVLFAFGSKLLASSLLETIFRNLYTIVIGKKFSAQELGYYARADQFAKFPSENLSAIIARVSYPIMCEMQNDNEQLKQVFLKFLRLSCFVIFPLMVAVAALAQPLIRLVLTEKWILTVPLLQVLCFAYITYPIHALNLAILQAKGRSDLFLKLEIVKKIVGIITLIITIHFGVLIMCVGQVIISFVNIYINVYYTNGIFNLDFKTQMKNIIPTSLLSISMGVGLYFLTLSGLTDSIILVSGMLLGIIYYFGVAKLINMREWLEIYPIIAESFKYLHRKR